MICDIYADTEFVQKKRMREETENAEEVSTTREQGE